MIKFISNWIEGIAVSVLIVSIFELILPNGNLKKYIKIILGSYVVFSIIAPFTSRNELYSFNLDEKVSEFSNETRDLSKSKQDNNINVNNIYISTFEREIIKTVQNKGFEIDRCTVNGNFSAENAKIHSIKIHIKGRKNNEENLEQKEDSIKVEKVEDVEISVGKKENNEIFENDITEDEISKLRKELSEYYEIEEHLIEIVF